MRILLLTLVIFSLLFTVSPMVSRRSYSNCGNNPYTGVCSGKTTWVVVFPMYRTIVCSLWHEAGCAYDTFLPEWSDTLIILENGLIVIFLGGASVFLAKRINRKYLST